ncbi:hypothetical protein [Sorangium sp. So ce406]|uniref:hypothetical protein n=1 Tax=Sorangium sp. So ce406 TaxID=3133311 RepID=UPI003F5C872C
MAVNKKTFDSPFLVDPSKLSRLRGVCLEKLGENVREEYEVASSGDENLKLSSIDDVTSLDNSKRQRIKRINIQYTAGNNSININLNGNWFTYTSISVTGPSKPWTLDTFSKVEEQTERLLQSDIVARARPWIGLSSIILVMWGGCVTSTISSPSSRMSHKDTLWLNSKDIEELKQSINKPGTDPVATLLDIQKRQISNLSAFETTQAHSKIIVTKHTIFGALPFVAVIVVTIYMLIACYPSAVFYWGDAKEWYDRIVERRKLLWWGVVIGSAVGVLGNFLTATITPTP